MAADPTRRIYDDCASRYHDRFRDYEPYRAKVLEFATSVVPGGEVLDLGCGSGVNARLMADAGLAVTGYDFSAAMLEIARRECPQGRFELVDLRELPVTGEFDALLASFCIVHFEDAEAERFLCRLPALMRVGATLYLSFMEGREPGWAKASFASEPLFYNYFERTWVAGVLARAGLEAISSSTHDYREEDGSTTTDVFLRFRKPARRTAGDDG